MNATDPNDRPHARPADPYLIRALGVIALFLTFPALLIAAVLLSPKPPAPPVVKIVESVVVNEAGGMQALLASNLYYEGREQFVMNCTACHGERGEEKPNLGKGIQHSRFVAELDDAGLMNYIKVGRRVDDPLNTTGIDMPPKGGSQALNDNDITKMIAYIRAIQAAARGEIELPEI